LLISKVVPQTTVTSTIHKKTNVNLAAQVSGVARNQA
jgi:hypothetical protein